MSNLLFVCTANRCRSPMAERLFARQLKIHHEDPDVWGISSAGTWAKNGIPPDEKLITAMDFYKIDIRDHQSQMLNEEIINSQDLILVMEHGHLEAVKFEFPQKSKQTFLISHMIGQNFDIPDPFSKDIKVYLRVAKQLEGIISQGYTKIIEYINFVN